LHVFKPKTEKPMYVLIYSNVIFISLEATMFLFAYNSVGFQLSIVNKNCMDRGGKGVGVV
jgi:hypothetical protein